MLCKPTLPVPPGESNVRFLHAVGTNNIRAARSVTANVFQIRCTAGEIVLCCGLSLPENLNRRDAAGGADEQLLAVGLDRRIVMNPVSVRRLLLALDRVLKEQAARFGNQG